MVVCGARATDDMNIGAAEDNIRSYHANLRVGIDGDKRARYTRARNSSLYWASTPEAASAALGKCTRFCATTTSQRPTMAARERLPIVRVRKREQGYEKLSQGNPGHGQTLTFLPSLRLNAINVISIVFRRLPEGEELV